MYLHCTAMFPARLKKEHDVVSKIRLAGRGIVSMKDPKIKGDQYVTIQIAVPQNLTEDAKRKLKEFTDACKTSSRHAA